MIINRFLLLLCLLFAGSVIADEIVLKDSHPTNYMIKQGDTLWSIASKFLRDPWRWPDIWQVNPQIKNPHLIYPGDEVALTFVDGKPQLILKRANSSMDNLRVVKMSPGMRASPLKRAVPTIPVDAIQQFLSRPDVMSEESLAAAPYLLSFQDERLITGAGNTVYARGIIPGSSSRFGIVRAGQVYKEGDEVLGIEAIYVGEAAVNNFDDPSTLTITESKREALLGDRLVPAVSQKMEYNFIPHAPQEQINGNIISVIDGVSYIGQYQTVVLNKGLEDGMEKGHVMAVFKKGKPMKDRIKDDTVSLPDEHAGFVLLFRIFNKVSYALVMKATTEIKLGDIVATP